MIELPRNNSPRSAEIGIRILGLGGAGANALDRMQLDGGGTVDLVVINTDAQSLAGSIAPTKLQIGAGVTRGLGAGGDPELGYQAAEESADELRNVMDGADVIFLCVGLGGGTGSGAAPLIASYARDQNALVVVFATMPFGFEGRRRKAQADEALGTLQSYADVVICFENDKMGDAVAPQAAIQEAFTVADQTISQSVRAIASMLQRRGLIHVGLDELVAALRKQNSRCLFGFGEAEGDNRAHLALERALKSPLMDRGHMLADADSVLVNVAGGPGLTLNEVQILMEEFNRHISESTRILFGTAIDPKLGNRLSVTILSSVEADGSVAIHMLEQAPATAEVLVAREEPAPKQPRIKEAAPLLSEMDAVAPPLIAVASMGGARPQEPARPSQMPHTSRPVAADGVAAKREVRQEQMQFEPVTRGRFEKSEPTIVDGQDLDVPTFLRRNVRQK